MERKLCENVPQKECQGIPVQPCTLVQCEEYRNVPRQTSLSNCSKRTMSRYSEGTMQISTSDSTWICSKRRMLWRSKTAVRSVKKCALINKTTKTATQLCFKVLKKILKLFIESSLHRQIAISYKSKCITIVRLFWGKPPILFPDSYFIIDYHKL